MTNTIPVEAGKKSVNLQQSSSSMLLFILLFALDCEFEVLNLPRLQGHLQSPPQQAPQCPLCTTMLLPVCAFLPFETLKFP